MVLQFHLEKWADLLSERLIDDFTLNPLSLVPIAFDTMRTAAYHYVTEPVPGMFLIAEADVEEFATQISIELIDTFLDLWEDDDVAQLIVEETILQTIPECCTMKTGVSCEIDKQYQEPPVGIL